MKKIIMATVALLLVGAGCTQRTTSPSEQTNQPGAGQGTGFPTTSVTTTPTSTGGTGIGTSTLPTTTIPATSTQVTTTSDSATS